MAEVDKGRSGAHRWSFPPGRNHSNLLVPKSRKNHLLISLMRFDSLFCTSGPVVVALVERPDGRMDGIDKRLAVETIKQKEKNICCNLPYPSGA